MNGKIDFVIINIVIPTILAIIYSKYNKKYQLQYTLSKGMFYLLYAGIVAYDYLINDQSRHVAGFTVALAIMEGMPLILKKIIGKDMQ